MRCDDVRELLPDRLDDLLAPDVARDLDAHVRTCEPCGVARRRAASLRAELYRPWPVPGPSLVLPMPRTPPHGQRAARWGLALLRYAAVFAAGAIVARTVTAPTEPPAATATTAVTPTVIASPGSASLLADYPRRIR